MNIHIPQVSDVRAELAELSHADVQELSRISEVPFTTIWKIRDGTTTNPGMETVRKFWAHIKAARKTTADGAPTVPFPQETAHG